ncbi:FAD-binding oxidoreductase [Mycolicibacterium stellerae]|uniref:FAD-binding oxidoreductase n=1 Tax=Mycolicibacterium stellerae TaxID=2358193 RepID=UPI000F0B9D93|nr:FAD-binding protein [Mycolicibacterium stellerae]
MTPGSGLVLAEPGSTAYTAATQPHNSTSAQHPRLVARISDAATGADAVEYARTTALKIVPQATGHGVSGNIGDDSLLVDTSALAQVVVDARSQTARVGAGAVWSSINRECEKHGLLGAAGSAPDVGVAGYTFGGGVGWLAPTHGLAAGTLRSVTYVDGSGRIRVASDEAADDVDREAIWAFRGAGGVGLALELTFDVFPVDQPLAGYMLWPANQLSAVITAWQNAIRTDDTTVATSLSVLHTQDAPPIPESLRNSVVVHLAAAAPFGAESAASFRAAMAQAPRPVVDTWGPANADVLAAIHLDPPPGIPALGTGRWLDEKALTAAHDILAAAVTSKTVLMTELRNVGSQPPLRHGALTSAPAPFLLHAVGAAPVPTRRAAVLAGLADIRESAATADIGHDAASFAEGMAGQRDALPADAWLRLQNVRTAVDPEGLFAQTRFNTAEGTQP